jgi:hypothetical protein
MDTNSLTKEQVIFLLSDKVNCAPDALFFLFSAKISSKECFESLKIPDFRAALHQENVVST